MGCPNDEPYRARYTELVGGERILELPHRAFRLRALAQIIRKVRSDSIEIIHSHGKGAGLYARLAGMLSGAKVVHTFHGLHIGEYGPTRKWAYLWLERFLGKVTTRGICVSDGEAAVIRDARLMPPDRLNVIYNGVQTPEIVATKSFAEPLKMIAVSRFDHQKNAEMLVDVTKSLKGRKRFELVVLGTGERFDQIGALIRSHGLQDDVQLAGGVPDIRPFLREADIFLSTSRWEGMPMAVLEAMSEGLCVVATNVVGNNDLVSHGVNGLLFEDAQEAAALLRALDPEDAITLSNAARSLVAEGYSSEVMAQKTFQLFGVDTTS